MKQRNQKEIGMISQNLAPQNPNLQNNRALSKYMFKIIKKIKVGKNHKEIIRQNKNHLENQEMKQIKLLKMKPQLTRIKLSRGLKQGVRHR